MSNRITALLGAGSILDLNRSDGVLAPSSQTILDEVLSIKTETFNMGAYSVLKEIYDWLVNVLRTDGSEEYRIAYRFYSLNFEELFHAVEMCYAYSGCWRHEYLHPKAYPLFGALIEPTDLLKKFQSIDFCRALHGATERIIQIIQAYDADFAKHRIENKWFVEFWRSFRNWNVFNLNYDSLVEQCICDYNDGYVPVISNPKMSRFAPDFYLTNSRNTPTISHLHGSIYYSEYHTQELNYSHSHRDLFKCADFELAAKERNLIQCLPQNQARESYFPLPIITGLHKTDKITFAPFNFYHANFANKICESNALLIVGYSFSDLYLNRIMQCNKRVHGNSTRVVLIDYMPRYICQYNDIARHILNSANGEYAEFIERMIEHNPLISIQPPMGEDKEPPMDFVAWDKPIVSKNGTLMMFICGFKNAVTMHGDTIMEFLQS